MRKLKNFFVRNETIGNGARGLIGFAKYLDDMGHKNHQYQTSEIIPLVGCKGDSFVNTVIGEADKLQLKRDKAGKGGRPLTTYVQSYLFSLPSNFVGKPTKEQYQAMAKDMLQVIADKIGLSLKEMNNHVKMNVHVNHNNPHINILVGRIIHGVNYEKILTRPSTSNALKRETYRTVKKRLGLDINQYKPIIPPGTTKGKRWDELNKAKSFKQKNTIDFLKKLNELNNKLSMSFENINGLMLEALQQQEQEIKALVTNINKSYKNSLKDIEYLINSEPDFELPENVIEDTKNLLEQTDNNINTYNNIKNKGRKIRNLKLSK